MSSDRRVPPHTIGLFRRRACEYQGMFGLTRQQRQRRTFPPLVMSGTIKGRKRVPALPTRNRENGLLFLPR